MTAQWMMTGTEEPIEGSTELGPVREWAIGALRTDDAFTPGLHLTGLPNTEIAAVEAIRREYFNPHLSYGITRPDPKLEPIMRLLKRKSF